MKLLSELWNTCKELKENCKALEVRKKWTYKIQIETELCMKLGHQTWKEHSPAQETSCLLPNTAARKHPLCWWAQCTTAPVHWWHWCALTQRVLCSAGMRYCKSLHSAESVASPPPSSYSLSLWMLEDCTIWFKVWQKSLSFYCNLYFLLYSLWGFCKSIHYFSAALCNFIILY